MVNAGRRVAYPRRGIRTRRQVTALSVLSTLIVLPPLVWRAAIERAAVAIALAGLALVAAMLAYRGLRFLAAQEHEHPEPTPGMMFVFTMIAVYPLAIDVFLLILLAEM